MTTSDRLDARLRARAIELRLRAEIEKQLAEPAGLRKYFGSALNDPDLGATLVNRLPDDRRFERLVFEHENVERWAAYIEAERERANSRWRSKESDVFGSLPAALRRWRDSLPDESTDPVLAVLIGDCHAAGFEMRDDHFRIGLRAMREAIRRVLVSRRR